MKNLVTAGLAASLLLSAAQATQAARAADAWKFATLLPMTGVSAAYADEMSMGFRIARDEINASGGIAGKPVDLTILDTQSNNGQVVSLMRRACNDDFIVLGPSMSVEARVGFPIANRMHCPAVSGSAVTDGLTTSNRPWTFTYSVPASVLVPSAIKVIVNKLHPKVATVVIDRGNASANEQGNRSVATLKADGIAVHVVTVTGDDVDFGPTVTRVVGEHPDLVILATTDKAALGVLKVLHQTGEKLAVLITQAAFTPLVASAGPAVLEGAYRYTEFDPTSSTNPRVEAFVAAFKKRDNGRLPTQLSTQTYDMMYMVKYIIEHAKITGSTQQDRQRFIAALAKLKNWPSFSGPLTMTPAGYPDKPISVLQFHDGVPHPVH